MTGWIYLIPEIEKTETGSLKCLIGAIDQALSMTEKISRKNKNYHH